MKARLCLFPTTLTLATLLPLLLLPASSWSQQGPRVLLLYDMEGVTGAVQPQDVSSGSSTYPSTRESLTEDVNAAIRGLLKAGAREIVLTDGHGSGNPDPDYLLEQLPAGARFDVRERPYDPYTESMDDSYAAMVAVAMHGRAGGQAFLAHTYNGHTRWIMAGLDMNESMLVAASAARFNIPLILVTGDDVLQREVAAFSPKTEYVVVKKALGVASAEARPRKQVSDEIEAAAERGLRNRAGIPPWRPAEIRQSFDNDYGYILPEQASVAIMFPGAESVDNKTVRLQTESFLEAYHAFRSLATFTGLASSRMTLNWVREMEGGAELISRAQQRMPGRAERTFAATGPEVVRTFGPGRHGYR